MLDLPPAADRSRTPSAQMVALLLLTVCPYALVALIIFIVVYGQAPDPVRLMLAAIAGSLLNDPKSVGGYYFGSSVGSAAKNQTIADLSATNNANSIAQGGEK